MIFILLIYFDPNYTNPNWTIEPKTNGRSKFLLCGPVSNRGNELCTCPDLSHSKIWSSQSFTLNGKKTFVKDVQGLMLTLHRLGDILYKRPKLSHLQPRQTCHPWYIAPPPSPLSPLIILHYQMQFLPNDGTLTNRVKEYLRSKFPPYMVPTFIILVNSLPVTSNGKLDRTMISGILISEPPEWLLCF